MFHAKERRTACLLFATAAVILQSAVQVGDAGELNLVPWPASVTAQEGTLALPAKPRVVVAGKSLQPLGEVLALEINAVSESKSQVRSGDSAPGDICLEFDDQLKGEAYTIRVTDRVVIRGGNYGAIANGTVTFLQSLTPDMRVPLLTVADAPAAPFRGLMLDVARKYHTIDSIKQIVQLCRLYKIRYLQLHLTDDQGFMFPSTAYPKLATQNQNGGKTYTIEALKDLVAYADARFVTIIPEYEVPGHSAAANRAMPDLFMIRDTKPYEHHASINFVKDDVMNAVETIVGEICEVFKSTPYFHIGGDEADLALANQNILMKEAMKKYDLPNVHELYRRFIAQMNVIVKKNGKQMIVWEGFNRGGKVEIPRDVIVMAYEIRFYMPDLLVKDGYQVINASWTPLYVVNNKVRPEAEIYGWNMFQFKPHGAAPESPGKVVADSDRVIGAQICAWEQPQEAEMPSLRRRAPPMAERIWNPTAGRSYEDFKKRLDATDRILDKLLSQ
ncbi:MAG: family 20 glycosylhydrolase [Planctomycetota bacterium]|nr:family 20 glycosylhydrolase [Planctomycetota bacterium]